MGTRRNALVSILLGLMMILGTVPGVLAQEQGSTDPDNEILFVARPKDGEDGERFSVEMAPGESKTLTMVLENPGTQPINLHSYSSSVGVAPNGGLLLSPEGAELTGASAWMSFEPVTQVVDPGQSQEVSFSIDVPDNTPPGEYVNAVAVETVDAFDVQGSSNIKQRLRKVLAVYVIVPGPTEAKLSFGEPVVELRARGPMIVIPVQNTGNVRTRGEGTLTLKDNTGTTLATETLYTSWLYGGFATTLEVRLKTVFPPGEYSLDLGFVDEESKDLGSLKNVPVEMPDAGALSNPVKFESAEITPNADPIQFANVAVTISNSGDTIRSPKVTLGVYRDDELVEDFVLSEGAPISQGETTFQQRYIPLTGFESGTYTFSLMVESVAGGSDATTMILSVDNIATLEVP